MEQHTLIEDHTLDGNDRVLTGLYNLSSERLFLNPIEDLHNIYLEKSRRVNPLDACNQLIDYLARGEITALDLAESLVANKPCFIEEFKELLKRRSELVEKPHPKGREHFSTLAKECLETIDELMDQNIQGHAHDKLYQRSFRSLLYDSGVLGSAGEIGSLNNHYYGDYCRRYDRLQVSVGDNVVGLYGFSTEQSQLEMIYDLMEELHEQGIVTEKISMSRADFSRIFQLSGGEIAMRGAYFAVTSGLGAIGIKTSDGKDLEIHANTSTALVLEKTLQLASLLSDNDMAAIMERFRDELGADVSETFAETISKLCPPDMPKESEQEYRWLLSELHHSLLLQYRARFHNESNELISEHGSIDFSVRVDQHREDYGYIYIHRQAIAPDAYKKIYQSYCG